MKAILVSVDPARCEIFRAKVSVFLQGWYNPLDNGIYYCQFPVRGKGGGGVGREQVGENCSLTAARLGTTVLVFRPSYIN